VAGGTLDVHPEVIAATSITLIPLIFQPIRKMASLLKTQEANAANRKGKRRADDMVVDVPEEPTPKRNKQRVLLLSSRGITHRMRHLMSDLEVLLPHVKKGARSVHLIGGVVFIQRVVCRLEVGFEESTGTPPRVGRPPQL